MSLPTTTRLAPAASSTPSSSTPTSSSSPNKPNIHSKLNQLPSKHNLFESRPNWSPKKPSGINGNWYDNDTRNKHTDDLENEEEYTNFDLAAASTPLNQNLQNSNNSNNSICFSSPINKLNNLHLESNIEDTLQKTNSNISTSSNSDYQSLSDSDNEFNLGNQTFHNDDGDDDEIFGDIEYKDDMKPSVNNRKRKRRVNDTSNNSVDMIITPKISNSNNNRDMSDICFSNISTISKVSFSINDSTPCPIQPRKRLKFKRNFNDLTPSQPSKIANNKKNLLNISNSIRKSSNSSLILKLNNINDQSPSEINASSPINNTIFSNIQHNTPISQSTPSNSRSTSPQILEEYGEPINGFKFLKPTGIKTNPYFNYQTPVPSKKSRSDFLKQNLSSNNDLGDDFPTNLMENDDDLHIADKRINDPYLQTPNNDSPIKMATTPTSQYELNKKIKLDYLNLTPSKLPLLQSFESYNLSESDILTLINDKVSVLNFYKFIVINESLEIEADFKSELLNLLKLERLKWHPDKWIGKYNDELGLSNLVIENLSQVLNGLVGEGNL